jgi:hypothetical protein
MPVYVEELYYRMQRSDSVRTSLPESFSNSMHDVLASWCTELHGALRKICVGLFFVTAKCVNTGDLNGTKYESDIDTGNVPLKLNIQ